VAGRDDVAYWERLTSILEARGFGWVVEQAEAQIAEGKPTSKDVLERQSYPVVDELTFAVSAPRRRRARLITSEPYSDAERLRILLEGLRSAIVDRQRVEDAVLENVGEIEAVIYEPDIPSEREPSSARGRRHQLDRERAKSREIAEQAAALIAELEAE